MKRCIALFGLLLTIGAPLETAWAFGSAPEPAPAPEPVLAGPTHGDFVLRVMSYNVQGLPLPGIDQTRYADIGRVLRDRRAQGEAPHIVALQETFDDRTEEIADESGYPYRARGEDAAFLRLSSGLMILSEYPIVSVERMTYDQCISWDCIPKKGAMRARIHVAGFPYPIDVYDTHMNSDPDSDNSITVEQTREIRDFQVRQYRDFLSRTRARDSVVFGPGDFNIPQLDPGYELFLSLMAFFEDGGAFCFGSRACTGGGFSPDQYAQSYDHVFYTPRSGVGDVSVQPVHFAAEFAHEVAGRMLSDHLAQEVHYFLSW